MKISEINIYPVKSLSGVSLEKSKVEKRGLEYDRRWMLVDKNFKFITQRDFPILATIKIDKFLKYIKLNHPGDFNSVRLSLDQNSNEFNEKVKVQVWQDVCEALVGNRFINEWFSEILQVKCRLVYMPEYSIRKLNKRFNRGDELVSFADGYPLLITNENSLAVLNNKLNDKIPMNRFRPNLVVAGAEGFAEDNWKKIKIGKTVFRIPKPCARCVITTIDQETGISDLKEPLNTLAEFRKAKDVYPENFENYGLDKNSILFGQNLVAENLGETIKVGDKLEILQ